MPFNDEAIFILRVENFEEVWEYLLWWLREDGLDVTEGVLHLAKERLVQTATFTSRLASGRVLTRVELRESPSGYWISGYRGKRRFANFRYDRTEGTFLVGMAMLSSHWD